MVEKIEVEKEIMQCIENRKNFLVSGGAGSGKTYTLIKTINLIKDKYPSTSIACITYTNMAVNEIKSRVINNDNLYVSTIHDFLWNNIKNYKKELKICLIELVKEGEIDYNGEIDNAEFDTIQYKEYRDINNGIISHDEVLKIAHKMYENYKVLCDILKDKYKFILVDEYQDTNKYVIEILLELIKKSKKTNVIGFYGDSMQAIYDDGIGDLGEYAQKYEIPVIIKKENRRNPKKIIDLANKLREGYDEVIQVPSEDKDAPNMKNGQIKEGKIKFLYSYGKMSDEELRKNEIFNDWNFENKDETRELNLTRKLIANKAEFSKLMDIYAYDPIMKLKKELTNVLNGKEVNESITFEELINQNIDKLKNEMKNINKNIINKELFDKVENRKFNDIKNIYFSADNLFANISSLNAEKDGIAKDILIRQLYKIENILVLYSNNEYNEFIKKTDFHILNINDKKDIKEKVDSLIDKKKNGSIEDVIDEADRLKLCIKDDKFTKFIKDNFYLYDRVKELPYVQFENYYNYREGKTPFATQHSIKGAEYNDVLVILDDGKWLSKYNFKRLFENFTATDSVSLRTKKIFYVCCTRAKERLFLYYNEPSTIILNNAKKWFGEENVVKI